MRFAGDYYVHPEPSDRVTVQVAEGRKAKLIAPDLAAGTASRDHPKSQKN